MIEREYALVVKPPKEKLMGPSMLLLMLIGTFILSA